MNLWSSPSGLKACPTATFSPTIYSSTITTRFLAPHPERGPRCRLQGVIKMRSSKTVNRAFGSWITCWIVRAAFLLVTCTALYGQAAGPANGELDVIQVRPNFYMIAGAGGNIGVQIGVDGVVLVDSGTEGASERVLAAIRKITPLQTRYIINTGAEPVYVGGNGTQAKVELTTST